VERHLYSLKRIRRSRSWIHWSYESMLRRPSCAPRPGSRHSWYDEGTRRYTIDLRLYSGQSFRKSVTFLSETNRFRPHVRAIQSLPIAYVPRSWDEHPLAAQ
jgi:hypothetical protein